MNLVQKYVCLRFYNVVVIGLIVHNGTRFAVAIATFAVVFGTSFSYYGTFLESQELLNGRITRCHQPSVLSAPLAATLLEETILTLSTNFFRTPLNCCWRLKRCERRYMASGYNQGQSILVMHVSVMLSIQKTYIEHVY